MDWRAPVRLLIIEDDPSIATLLTGGLESDGYLIDVTHSGHDGLHLALHGCYDAVILDLMLPDTHGLDILRRLRHEHRHLPVLVLSARCSVADRLECHAAGANWFLGKPFAFTDLRTGLDALLHVGP